MPNQEHLQLLRGGVEAWNRWRRGHPGEKMDLSGAVIGAENLSGADLHEADLCGAYLNDANLGNADLSNANLRGANLSGASFSGANLSGANLSGANLHAAHLFLADLSGANFNGADFFLTNLSGANLSKAQLKDARLRGVNLSVADLRGADLSGASFFRPKLRGADLTGCKLGTTIFSDSDLSEPKGLEAVVHLFPSTIGIDTFCRSQGRIPEGFLRGVGVPDPFLHCAGLVAGMPFELCSCFLCYAREDEGLARRLYADLQAKGVRCWLAPKAPKPERDYRTEIDRAFRTVDRLVLMLSEHSVSNDWLEKEVEAALELERQERRTVLFPICLDQAGQQSPGPWQAEKRPAGDFTNWQDSQAYRQALDRLLRDLKAGSPK